MFYIWEHEEWPNFEWDIAALSGLFERAAFAQGRLLGAMSRIGFSERKEAAALALIRETSKSSEIEGVSLSLAQIRSSVGKRLALRVPAPKTEDRRAAGAAETLLDATQNFALPMTKKRLCAWHAALFPDGFSGVEKIRTGTYRDDRFGGMRVVSIRGNRETVHFEAPPAARVPAEMRAFFESLRKPRGNALAEAAIAHLRFLSIHPFEDGNGRLARALTEMMLARAENSALRFYSFSERIRKDRRSYYAILEKTQSGGLDVSAWMEWFLNALIAAVADSETLLSGVLAKADFWRAHGEKIADPAQRKIINRLFDGFEGNLTSSKWAKICKCSQDTASRAIRDLVEKKILRPVSAGRAAHYVLAGKTRVPAGKASE